MSMSYVRWLFWKKAYYIKKKSSNNYTCSSGGMTKDIDFLLNVLDGNRTMEWTQELDYREA